MRPSKIDPRLAAMGLASCIKELKRRLAEEKSPQKRMLIKQKIKRLKKKR